MVNPSFRGCSSLGMALGNVGFMVDPLTRPLVMPVARLRLARIDRHDARVVFDIHRGLVVLGHELFAQSPWSHTWPTTQQAILVRNPDAWRLRILSGPPAERGGIASEEWVLDSGLKLDWAGWTMTLEILEPGFQTGVHLDQSSLNSPTQEFDSRSSLYKLASTLAAAQLQLDQQSDFFQTKEEELASSRKRLGRALAKRFQKLKRIENRMGKRRTDLEQDQATINILADGLSKERNRLGAIAKGLNRREKIHNTLRRRGSIRWRAHVMESVTKLRQNQLLISTKLSAAKELLFQLEQREAHLVQGETDLFLARTQLATDATQSDQENLTRHGQWLLKQAELTHHEERLRAEARILGELGAPLRDLLSRTETVHATEIIRVLQDHITAIAAEPVKYADLDSWQKRVELWAATTSERELAVGKREKELYRLVSAFQELRARQEAELAVDFFQKQTHRIQQIEQLPESSGAPRDLLVLKLPPPKGKLRPRTKQRNPLGKSTVSINNLTHQAELAHREAKLDQRANRLAEEAEVLERYRMKLMSRSENPDRSREEVRALQAQRRKRREREEATLKASRMEILNLLENLRRQAAKLTKRIKATTRDQLDLVENRAWSEVTQLLQHHGETKAA